MDRWAWAHLDPWLELRKALPVGRLFCVVRGPTRGRPCASAGIRAQLHQAAEAAGVRRRFAPHQLRHAHAVEMSREGIPLLVIQRQLGHADLAITSRYLRGIDNTEIIAAVHERPAPMIPADLGIAPRRRHRTSSPRTASRSQTQSCGRDRVATTPPALTRSGKRAGRASETGVRASTPPSRTYLPCKHWARRCSNKERAVRSSPCTATSSRRTSLSIAARSW